MQCSQNAILTSAVVADLGVLPDKALAVPLLPQAVMALEVCRISKDRRMMCPLWSACSEEDRIGMVDFHVLRRTHASLMRALGVDSKVVADQQGHTLDVNLNVYTVSSLERLIEAVEQLESAF